MSALGTCSNVERCSKAVSREPIDLYPGIGEVCPECGRRLVPAQGVAPQPQQLDPIDAGRQTPETLQPMASPLSIDQQPSPPAPELATQPGERSGFRPKVIAAQSSGTPSRVSPPVLELDAPIVAPVTGLATAVDVAEPERSSATGPAGNDRSDSWVIKPLEAGVADGQGNADSVAPRKKRKPAVYAGIALSTAVAIGGGYYAASNGAINVPGIPGFSVVAAASALPIAPTFKICSSNGVSEKLVPDLVRGFLGKLGAPAVDASAAKGTYSAQIPNHAPALIEVTSGDSAQAFSSLASGACQLAVTQAALPAKMRGVKPAVGETILGLAGVAIVVNPSNSVQQLGVDQVVKIFNGTITNWSQAGGPDLPISIIVPPAQSDEYGAFKAMVLKDAALAPGAKRMDPVARVAASVAKAPGAIGITALSDAAPGRVLRLVTRDGTAIVANPVNIGLKRYPLTTTVYVYDAAQSADPLARQFVAFTQSDAGQSIVSNSNFVGRNSF